MKICLVFLTTLISFGGISSEKCDAKRVAAIQKLWEKHADDHSGVLQELIKSKYAIVVRGTRGLIPDEDKIERLGARFTGSSVENVHLYKNQTKVTFPKFQVEDVNGRDLYTKDQQRHRYYFPYDKKNGVVGFHLCEDTGVSGNNPRGNIVIYSKDYNKNAVTEIEKTMASVGLIMAKTYPDTFPGLV